ncbi:MAG: hypothetical protein WCO84_06640 [bacterium]
MFLFTSHITITGAQATLEFKTTAGVEIVSDMQKLTDTCRILMPRKLIYKGRPLYELMNAGDKVKVELGYDFKNEVVFEGYIRLVRKQKMPVEIECEDKMYLLKKIQIPAYQSDNLNMKEFVEEFLPKDMERDVQDCMIGKFRFTNCTLADALDRIKKEYPNSFFFRQGKFYGILPSSLVSKDANYSKIILKFKHNIVTDNVAESDPEDERIQIVAKTITAKGEALEVKVPETLDNGNVRTFSCLNLSTKEELKKFAEEKLKTWKTDSISGNLKLFGLPVVRVLDVVKFKDDENSYRNDKSFTIGSVKRSFGMGGYRQEITLLNAV